MSVPVEGPLLGFSLFDDEGGSLGDLLGCPLDDALGKEVGKCVESLEEGRLLGSNLLLSLGEELGDLLGEPLGLWLALPDEGIPLG